MQKTLLYFLVFLALGSNIVWLQAYKNKDSSNPSPKNNAADYSYLSKRIFIENQNDILINFQPLRKQIEAKMALLPPGTEVSLYFEYLPSGTSIRVGDNTELVAASLIKLPMVMNLFKAAEMGKINLDTKVALTPDTIDNEYGQLWKRGVGTTLSLREAAKLAVADSDNTASRLIFNNIRGLLKESEQSFAQLDIDQNLKDGQAVINAKSYTSVLKSLYFASYVNRDSSQEVLSYLTESTEDRRLTAKLPNDIKVAHKNGVYSAKWAESDCGIVYLPNRPYAVCVMVGLPDPDSNSFIADTSKMIYDYVKNYK